MTLRTRIEPISDWITISVDQTLSEEARSKQVADFARQRIDEARDTNARVLGRVPPSVTYVDGRKGAALDSVNPDRGVIIVEFELIVDVLRWIGQTLRDRSPVVSGDYRDAHTVFADGVEVQIGDQMPIAEEYSFTNLVPYARKIEIGKTKSGRNFLVQVEPRIYQRTAKDARARFGNLVRIEFTFRGIVGGYQINPLGVGGSSRKRGKNGRFLFSGGAAAHNRSEVRYPTIVVRPN